MVACTQTLEIIKGIYEKAAEQCAPVIFDIKPSNLLIIDSQYARALKSLIEETGLKARCFEHGGGKQIWFLFREETLRETLENADNRAFIEQFGYGSYMNLDEMLIYVAKRFRMYKRGEIGFPHEMGIFLGYPLGDVKGFIEHEGKDYICTGYWKVYENEQKARETFQLYARVKALGMEMVRKGFTFTTARQYASYYQFA